MKHLSLYLLLYLLVLGCSKDAVEDMKNEPEPNDTITELPIVFKKLKKTTGLNSNTVEYFYEDGLLVKKESKSNPKIYDWIYEYDDDERIIKYTVDKKYTPTLRDVYVNTVHYLDDGNIEIYRVLNGTKNIKRHLLIENNLVKVLTDSLWVNNELFFFMSDTFKYDENGNNIETYTVTSGISTATYTYDNKRNKYYGLNKSVKLLFKGTSNNNQISVNNVSNHDTYTYEYTREYIYDADDYPINVTTLDENGNFASYYDIEYYEN